MHLSHVSQMALGLASRQVLQTSVADWHCNLALVTSLTRATFAVDGNGIAQSHINYWLL